MFLHHFAGIFWGNIENPAWVGGAVNYQNIVENFPSAQ
jgi:hypothetical protein